MLSTSAAIALHERFRVPALAGRKFTHREFWDAVGPLTEADGFAEREEIGRSAEGRPLYLVRCGTGATNVLVVSQMHGDEPTGTMALADLIRLYAEAPDLPIVDRLAGRLTVLMVPMLNPDGAERSQRYNAQGLDINRDAESFASPELRALLSVQERARAPFCLSLHDQQADKRVGESERLVALSLLAPRPDPSGEEIGTVLQARSVAGVLARAVDPLVAGHISRYQDEFLKLSFEEFTQSEGSSTILIETGGWWGDVERQHLRRVAFVALLAALDAIAEKSYSDKDAAWYDDLPATGDELLHLLIIGGQLVVPGLDPYRADLAIRFEDAIERTRGRIADVAKLKGTPAMEVIDATDVYLHFDRGVPTSDDGRVAVLRPGMPASFTIRRGATPESEALWVADEGVLRPAERD